MGKLEYRAFPVELRVNRDGDKPKIEGYAAVFDQLSEDLGGFREKIRYGAFRKTIKEDDIRALMNHDSNYVLARNVAGTLSLSEDDHGLKIEIDPPDTTWARDLMVSMERGDVDQMSFAFRVRKDGSEWTEKDGLVERELIDVMLYDVSVVTFPAYPQTIAQVRDAGEVFTEYEQRRAASQAAADPADGIAFAQGRIAVARRRLELELLI